MIALTRGEMTHSRVTLSTRLAEVRSIKGDTVQLQQVILNLILNALEAMGDNEPRDLLIESEENDGRNTIVSVSDSGQGVDAATVDRIFEPFYSTKQDGIGDRLVDLSVNHRSARRKNLGTAEQRARQHVSVHPPDCEYASRGLRPIAIALSPAR